MAANLNTPETEDGESSLFNPKSPHFFKIIIDGMGQSQKLTIPRYFIRKYAVDLAKSEFVILKVPTGAVWRVGLSTGDDGSVWLVNGWSDFVKFYSIKLGDFLVFCYKPVSLNEFDVVLFDGSATEIEYPLKDRVKPSRVKLEELSDDGDNDDDEDDDVDVTLISETYGGLMSSSRINRRKSRGLSGNSRTLKGAEKLAALGRARHFRSSNPHIPIVIQPSYLHPAYKLNVSVRFLEWCVDQKQSELKLYVDSGKLWTVKYRIIRGVAKFLRGWKEFVLDNGLVVGDVCVFERIRGLKNVSFKVAIFQATRTVASCPSLSQDGKCQQKIPNPLRTRPVNHLAKSKSPCFHIVMTKSYLSRLQPYIPMSFTRDHLNIEIKEQMVTLKVQDRSWPASFIIYNPSLTKPKAYFGFGFKAFAKENSLQNGDLCTFELIQKAEMMFRVSISKANKQPKDSTS